MKEYKTVSIDTTQGWGASKGTADVQKVDIVLNQMAREGWELACMEDLEHGAGSRCLLCVFVRDKA